VTRVDDIPSDPAALQALLVETRTQLASERAEIERLRAIISALQRHRFGPRSERLDPAQLALGLEDVEQSVAAAEEEQRRKLPRAQRAASAPRQTNRGSLPKHLPRVEKVVDIGTTTCPCCAKEMTKIGEDVAERLDVVPASFQVIVTRRPKYACRTCPGTVVQAEAPPRLIEGGLPTEALVAQVVISKFADHTPLYRQAAIYARQGVEVDRSTLCDWVGRAAQWLKPLHERLLASLRASPKLFADETTVPVLEPGRGRAKTGQLWTYARDDRPWQGALPPAVAYLYAADRSAAQVTDHLQGFTGVLQVDGYGAYRKFSETTGVALAFCWSHARRRFYEIAKANAAPIADGALKRIAALYAIEAEIRGRSAEQRRAARLQRTKPLLDALEPWLKEKLATVAQNSPIAEAIRYALKYWQGLTRFVDDGRIEIDSNTVERAIKPQVLTRKNALFAGNDGGAAHWAIAASLIETCKLAAVDPQAYLTDVLQRLVAGHADDKLDDLMPWVWAAERGRQRAAA
jgi:transposase